MDNRLSSIIFGLLLWTPLWRSPAQPGTPAAPAAIYAPQPGQALQGSVAINGHTAVDGFVSAELSFAYDQDVRGTWFLIQDMDQPVSNGTLTDWDTTTLTDGRYTLRLVIFLEQEDPVVVTVSGLRLRNYTPVETDTPPPPTPSQEVTAAPIPTPTSTPVPAPPALESLPPNPAEISPEQISGSLASGALAVLGLFSLLALYVAVRQVIHWRRERG